MKGKFRSSSLLLSSVLSLAPAYCIANRSDCKEDSIASSSNKKDSSHDIAVYLNTASRSELSAYLRKYGVEGDVDTSRVVVRRSCSSRDSYFYEPLFGERAAFRLKGLVKTESGSIAVSFVCCIIPLVLYIALLFLATVINQLTFLSSIESTGCRPCFHTHRRVD